MIKVRYWIQWKYKWHCQFLDAVSNYNSNWHDHLEFYNYDEAKQYLIKTEGGYYPKGLYKFRIKKVVTND